MHSTTLGLGRSCQPKQMLRYFAVVFVAGCAGESNATPDNDASVAVAVDAAADGGTYAEEAFRTLVEVNWDLPPGTEQYLCARVTITEPMLLHAFRSLTPLGTHHNALSVRETPDAPDGVTKCNVFEVAPRNVFGSGVGSREVSLPDGIAVQLSPGNQLLLNLHLFNVGDMPLSGRSGVETKTLAPEQVRELADSMTAGPLALTVPSGRSTQQGHCTIERDMTLYRVTPHMHQTGVYIKVVARSSSSGDVVLHDGPYDFDQQLAYPIDMLRMNAGDGVDIECTYENPTGHALHWGESTLDEMCFAGLARFPAGGSAVCAN